jgi:hypothetical protein
MLHFPDTSLSCLVMQIEDGGGRDGKGSASATQYLSTVFRGAYSRARFRGAQLIGLINERCLSTATSHYSHSSLLFPSPSLPLSLALSPFPPARRFYITAPSPYSERNVELRTGQYFSSGRKSLGNRCARQEIAQDASRSEKSSRRKAMAERSSRMPWCSLLVG